MQEWLKVVRLFQNIQDITDLENIDLDGKLKFFLSMLIQQGINLGYYNPDQKTFVLGPAPPSLSDARSIVTDTDVDVVSDADHTLTCPAGHAYKVISATIKNSTDAAGSYGEVTYTPSGGTASIFTQVAGAAAQGETNVLIGQGSPHSGGGGHVWLEYLWMQAGDTLKIEDLNFGAGDVMRKEFIFEDYTL